MCHRCCQFSKSVTEQSLSWGSLVYLKMCLFLIREEDVQFDYLHIMALRYTTFLLFDCKYYLPVFCKIWSIMVKPRVWSAECRWAVKAYLRWRAVRRGLWLEVDGGATGRLRIGGCMLQRVCSTMAAFREMQREARWARGKYGGKRKYRLGRQGCRLRKDVEGAQGWRQIRVVFFAKWRKAWKRPVGGIVAGSINEKP